MDNLFNFLKKYNGFIFDLIQFGLGSLVFYALGLRLSANVSIVNGGVSAGNDVVSVVILILTVIAQPVGALFLRDSVQNYYADPYRKPFGPVSTFFMFGVVTLHLILFGMFVIDILKNIGLDPVKIFDEYPFYIDIVFGIFLFIAAVIPTVLTCFILIPDKKEFKISSNSLFKTLAGDFIISFSAFVFISIFWDNLIATLAEDLSEESTGIKITSVILFFFIFLMIYLPARLVFLVTDSNRLTTWIRIVIVYFPFLLGVL